MRWLLPTSRHHMLLGFARGYFSTDADSLAIWETSAGTPVALAMTAPPTPSDLGRIPGSSTDYAVLLEVHELGSLPLERRAVGNSVVAPLRGWLPADAVRHAYVGGQREADEIYARAFGDIRDGEIPLSTRPQFFDGTSWTTDVDAILGELRDVRQPAPVEAAGTEAAAAFLGALMQADMQPVVKDIVSASLAEWLGLSMGAPADLVTSASRALVGANRGEDLTPLIVAALMNFSPSPEPDGEALAEALADLHTDNGRWAAAIGRIREVVSDFAADIEVANPNARRELQALLLLLLRPYPRGACGADWPGVNVDSRTLLLARAWSHLLAGRLPPPNEITQGQAGQILRGLVNRLNRAGHTGLPEFVPHVPAALTA